MIKHEVKQVLDQKKKEAKELANYKHFIKECCDHRICADCGHKVKDIAKWYRFSTYRWYCENCGSIFRYVYEQHVGCYAYKEKKVGNE